MIKSIEAKFFRKHEDLKITFTKGLNVLRGPNEIGKTTVTEAILYAFYGAAALVDKLDEVVTWGQKDTALKVKMVTTIGDTDYTFTRSKAGAEVNYVVNGTAIKVTGQKEVTAFAATLLGADAKTSSVLMLSSQAGLRGALDEGPTAVGALMGKLADFDTVDRLLENASKTLALGSDGPLQQKLREAEVEVIDATNSQLDPATVPKIDQIISGYDVELAVSRSTEADLTSHLDVADTARTAAMVNNSAVDGAARQCASIRDEIAKARSRLLTTQAEIAKRPDPSRVTALRTQLSAAQSHAATVKAYNAFLAIPAYPAVAWDEDRASFNVYLTGVLSQLQAAKLSAREVEMQITTTKSNLIKDGGKCHSCGHVADNAAHVAEHNAVVNTRLLVLDHKLIDANATLKVVTTDWSVTAGVQTEADRRAPLISRVPAEHIAVDESVFPSKVSWVGDYPAAAINTDPIVSAIATLEAEERAAVKAEGQAAAYADAVAEHVASLARASAAAVLLSPIAIEPLNEAYDVLFGTYTAQAAKSRQIMESRDIQKEERAAALQIIAAQEQRIATAQGRVEEYLTDLKTLDFNNELVRKLKSMKPMITDHLWNNVLAAVGNFFSVLRGEQSIVTKDAGGFRVNGRGGSLSGSTLDMLALAIRVALSKTFVPHANFMVLDEPAHGCDDVRAGNLLGFLSGVGFAQTILASHDELSESVADNVINLGS